MTFNPKTGMLDWIFFYRKDDMDDTQSHPANPPRGFETACGGRIRNPQAYPSAEYRGKRVYFCAPGCLRAFLTDPDGFMAGKVEHPLDED